MDLGRLMGIGRWGVIGGLLLTSGGFALDSPDIAWGGVGIVLFALAVNTAGKFVHYARLSIPRERRAAIVAAWLLLATTIGALIVDYVYARLIADHEGYFWALVIATAGFAAVYRGLRTRYVPESGG